MESKEFYENKVAKVDGDGEEITNGSGNAKEYTYRYPYPVYLYGGSMYSATDLVTARIRIGGKSMSYNDRMVTAHEYFGEKSGAGKIWPFKQYVPANTDIVVKLQNNDSAGKDIYHSIRFYAAPNEG